MLFPGASSKYRELVLAGRPLKYPYWGLGDFAGAVIAAVVVSAFASVIMLSLRIDAKHGWPLVLTLALPWIPMFCYPLVSTKYKGNGLDVDLGLTDAPNHIRIGVAAGVLCLILSGATAWVSVKLFGPISSAAGDAASKEHGLVRVVFAILAMSIGPIVEEIIFRGMLLGSLLKREMAPWLAVLTSALAFSIFHFEPKRILILLVAGLVLAAVRLRTGSTGASAIAHAVNNTPAAIALIFGAFH